MNTSKFDFERSSVKQVQKECHNLDSNIDSKYEKGFSRVVTETGSYKVSLVKSVFSQDNFNLQPDYQRRITWDTKKRSKLIESLIINIPIPPIFLYEHDYDKYEVMDGLQRITAIIAFYQNEYKLTGLEEWAELNGKYYKDLPPRIKDGIDRRQLQVITLLKESAQTKERAEKIKRLVFERLNTGGVKLLPQEIRNAIYNGLGNDMCNKLAENSAFRVLWNIPDLADVAAEPDSDDEYLSAIEDEKIKKKLERHALYKRMYDVELVLRFFAMRYLDEYDYALADFMDDTLIALNNYSPEQLDQLKNLFEETVDKAYKLFGNKALCIYDGAKWSSPARMVFDPMMIVLAQKDIFVGETNVGENVLKLQAFYSEAQKNKESLLFDGKHQSKDDIQNRVDALDSFIRSLCK